jgi:hypothetical protein
VPAQIDDENVVSNALNLFFIRFQLTFFSKEKGSMERTSWKLFLLGFFREDPIIDLELIRLNQISFLEIEIDKNWKEKMKTWKR